MAGGGAEFDRNHSFSWNFSILEGVMVKISDKYRPPRKVTLPVGWKPFQHKGQFKFDFTFEEDVIKMAKQEKLQEEREKEDAEVAGLLYNNDPVGEDSSENKNEKIEGNTDENSEEAAEDDDVNLLSDINDAPVLEPTRINADHCDPAIVRTKNKGPKDFNFSEFEDNFATPFELVELQTLDDIDELTSVLQPGCKAKKGGKVKKVALNAKAEGEIDFSIFNTPVSISQEPTSIKNSQVATGSLIPGIDQMHSLPADSRFAPLAMSYDRRFNADFASGPSKSNMKLERQFDSVSTSENSIRQMYPGNIVLTTSSPQTVVSQNISGRYGAPVFSNSPMSLNTVRTLEMPMDSRGPLDANEHRDVRRPLNTRGPLNARGPVDANGQLDFRGQMSPREPSELRTSTSSPNHLKYVSETFASLDLSKPSFGRNKTANSGKMSVPEKTNLTYRYDDDGLEVNRTNLNKSNSRSLPNLADVGLESFEQSTKTQPSYEQEPVLSTSRIDSIMKQFQLNRLREFNSTANESGAKNESPVHYDTVPLSKPRPISRHGVLPPLSPRNVSYASSTGPSNYPPLQNSVDDNRYFTFDENGRGISRLEDTQRQKIGHPEALPPILTPSPPRTPVTRSNSASSLSKIDAVQGLRRSWLPDPTSSLSAKELAFASMIAAMGFPKARTARAVERLKDDEKEIIDFLVQVQQVADMGYDADDVEMAIINNKNDKETIMNYLTLANKWKELGFPIQKVHDALKNTNKENEAMFEYLTT